MISLRGLADLTGCPISQGLFWPISEICLRVESRCWFQRCFYFQPRSLGGNDPIWRTYFSTGLVQTPTSEILPPKKILGGRFGCSPCFVEQKYSAVFFLALSFLRPGFNVLGTAKIVVVGCLLKRICFSRSLLSKNVTPRNLWRKFV